MSKEKHILVGKVYANWCGHCKNLKPVWKELKRSLKKKMKSLGLKIDFVEIEESETKKMERFKKWNPDLEVNGYPTIFKKKKGGKIEYYNQDRELEKMQNWILDKNQEKEEFSLFGGKSKKLKKTKTSKKTRTKRSKTEKKEKGTKQKKTLKRKKSKNKTKSSFLSLFSFGK